MKIDGREVTNQNYLDPVTYVPPHVKGNAAHADCEQGVIINVRDTDIAVLYCRSRTVQITNPSDLIWD